MNTKIKHTPGPWKVIANDGWHSSPLEIVNNEGHVAIASPIGSVEEQIANANLIAAAPELLEALQHFVKVCETGSPVNLVTELGNSCTMAKLAIQKVLKEGHEN